MGSSSTTAPAPAPIPWADMLRDPGLYGNVLNVLLMILYLFLDYSRGYENAHHYFPDIGFVVGAVGFVVDALIFLSAWEGAVPHPDGPSLWAEYLNVIGSVIYLGTAVLYPSESVAPIADAVFILEALATLLFFAASLLVLQIYLTDLTFEGPEWAEWADGGDGGDGEAEVSVRRGKEQSAASGSDGWDGGEADEGFRTKGSKKSSLASMMMISAPEATTTMSIQDGDAISGYTGGLGGGGDRGAQAALLGMGGPPSLLSRGSSTAAGSSSSSSSSRRDSWGADGGTGGGAGGRRRGRGWCGRGGCTLRRAYAGAVQLALDVDFWGNVFNVVPAVIYLVAASGGLQLHFTSRDELLQGTAEEHVAAAAAGSADSGSTGGSIGGSFLGLGLQARAAQMALYAAAAGGRGARRLARRMSAVLPASLTERRPSILVTMSRSYVIADVMWTVDALLYCIGWWKSWTAPAAEAEAEEEKAEGSGEGEGAKEAGDGDGHQEESQVEGYHVMGRLHGPATKLLACLGGVFCCCCRRG